MSKIDDMAAEGKPTLEFITTLSTRKRKKLYEHTCYLCDQAYLSPKQRKIYFCHTCLLPQNNGRREAAMSVRHNLHRAERIGLAATLTVRQWLETLEYFKWRCAYCSGTYECMEHLIPLVCQGGTTQDNVVPACRSCNSLKTFNAPELAFGKEVIEYITSYFKSLSGRAEE